MLLGRLSPCPRTLREGHQSPESVRTLTIIPYIYCCRRRRLPWFATINVLLSFPPPAFFSPRFSLIMYLLASEVKALLQAPYYSNPTTESFIQYRSYRGQLNVTVLTLRFNLTPQFDVSSMHRVFIDILGQRYAANTQLYCSVHYDFLLVDNAASPKSYYIWRSNTNRTHFDATHEVCLTCNPSSLLRFSQQAMNFDLDTLELNFTHSNVTIDKVLAIVFTVVE